MTVYPCTFIVPSFFNGCICAYCNNIIASVIQIVCDVVCKRIVSAVVLTEVEPIDPYFRVAVYSVKLNGYLFPQVSFRDGKCLPVPAYTCLLYTSDAADDLL